MARIIHTNTAGNNIVFGNANDENIFVGYGEGLDILVGGNRNDWFNLTFEYGPHVDTVYGGAGQDTISYSTAERGLYINLAEGQAGIWVYDWDPQLNGPNLDGFSPSDPMVLELSTIFNSIENVVGTAYSDRILGDHNNNTLEGGAGGDLLYGAAGSDTASYVNSNQGVHVYLQGLPGGVGGLAEQIGFGFGGDANGDELVSIENVIGSGYDDVFSGSRANNTFDGGDGVDRVTYEHASEGVNVDLRDGTVQGGQSVGTDTLLNIELVEGSRFADTFRASTAADTFVFGSNIGHDTIDGFDAAGNIHDVIRLEGVFDSWEDLQANLEDDGPDVVIHIDDQNSITLTNVSFGQIGESDFDLA